MAIFLLQCKICYVSDGWLWYLPVINMRAFVVYLNGYQAFPCVVVAPFMDNFCNYCKREIVFEWSHMVAPNDNALGYMEFVFAPNIYEEFFQKKKN